MIHEMPAGKIGVYTRFFEYANFRLPLSTFLVNVLKHYRIHISQLSVISATKNASTTVSKDPIPKSSQYNAEHYATLVAYPAPFHKYPEPFLCLVRISRYYTLDENTYPQFLRDNNEEMDLLVFIRTANPTKARIGERQRGEDEPKLLDTTVGRSVPLLPVAPARAQSKLDASVDRLFDEEGSGNEEEHHDSADVGQGAGNLIISEAAEVVAKDVIPLRSRQRKQKTIVDAGKPSHPAKKLRDDYGAPGGPSVASKSRSEVQRLLVRAVLNAEVRGEPILTLPFVTSSVSATLEREDEHPVDSVTGINLWTISVPQRFVISSYSSHHSSANIAEAEVDSIARSSAPIIATVVIATADVATTTKEAPAKIYYELKLLKERNVALKEEKGVLDVKVVDLAATVKVREQEAANSDALVTSVKLQNDSLADQVRELEASSAGLQEKVTAYEKFVDQLEKFQDDKKKEVNDKLEKLDADVVAMVLYLEEKFYLHLLNTIVGRRWLLTYGMELAVTKCLNSIEYLSALGAAIGKAVEKGMQEGLFAGISHGIEGRTLADVVAYNPFAEADNLAALHHL
ncbi:hypothetical protein Tco_0421026 [Tanacetum coccineum]